MEDIPEFHFCFAWPLYGITGCIDVHVPVGADPVDCATQAVREALSYIQEQSDANARSAQLQ